MLKVSTSICIISRTSLCLSWHQPSISSTAGTSRA